MVTVLQDVPTAFKAVGDVFVLLFGDLPSVAACYVRVWFQFMEGRQHQRVSFRLGGNVLGEGIGHGLQPRVIGGLRQNDVAVVSMGIVGDVDEIVSAFSSTREVPVRV